VLDFLIGAATFNGDDYFYRILPGSVIFKTPNYLMFLPNRMKPLASGSPAGFLSS
jgi:hypothetical protein